MGIELHNITKHYRVGVEEIRALDGVSLASATMNTSPSWAPAAQAKARS